MRRLACRICFLIALGLLASRVRCARAALSVADGTGRLAGWRALFVVCEGTDEVVVIRHRSRPSRAHPVGHVPKDLALSPDGGASTWRTPGATRSPNRYAVARSGPHLPGGFEPNAVIVDRAERNLYVANRIGNDIRWWISPRRRRPNACWRAVAPATWRSRPMAAGSTRRTYTRARENPRPPIGNHGDRYRPADRDRPLTAR